MDRMEIDKYLRAKKQLKIERMITISLIALSIVFIVLMVMNINFPYMTQIMFGVFAGALIINAGGWRRVTYSDLVQIIEKEVNRDPAAVEYVAKHDA